MQEKPENLYEQKQSAYKNYRKIPEISPGAYIFQRSFLRGLCTEGNLRLKIDWASLLLGRKFTVFLCFTLYLTEISKYKPLEGGGGGGAYIWRSDLTEGFLRYEDGGLIFGGAYFRNFTVFTMKLLHVFKSLKKSNRTHKILHL